MAIFPVTHYYLVFINERVYALIQLCDNLFKSMDDGKLNCVVFLDVRKAFDLLNHEILINKMRKFFEVTGKHFMVYILFE